MEFKKSEEYIKIKEELELNNIIIKEFKLEVVQNGVIVFSLKDGDVLHNFSIIADDTFFSKMSALDLMNLKRVKFFNHVIYINDKKESEVRWSLSDKKWLKSFENSI
tara:strand:+ start:1427 stop:1747 length:321 start_codon:yes stop_codon:yes gene_type:complete